MGIRDCDGNCPSCRASSVHNELTAEAKEKLVQQFAWLRQRYRRRYPPLPTKRKRFWDDWEYPYG